MRINCSPPTHSLLRPEPFRGGSGSLEGGGVGGHDKACRPRGGGVRRAVAVGRGSPGLAHHQRAGQVVPRVGVAVEQVVGLRPRSAWGSRRRSTPTSRISVGKPSGLSAPPRPDRGSTPWLVTGGLAERPARRFVVRRHRARPPWRARARAARSSRAPSRRRRTSATITAWSGDPLTKFLVPSTGSTVKPCSAARNGASASSSVGVGLLAEHHRVGIGLEQRLGDQLLGLVVGHGDQVAGPLLVDLRAR